MKSLTDMKLKSEAIKLVKFLEKTEEYHKNILEELDKRCLNF